MNWQLFEKDNQMTFEEFRAENPAGFLLPDWPGGQIMQQRKRGGDPQ